MLKLLRELSTFYELKGYIVDLVFQISISHARRTSLILLYMFKH